MHYLQSVHGRSSVAVTEKYSAKFRPDAAAKAVLAIMESARKERDLARFIAKGG